MALVVGLDIGTKTLTGAVFSGSAKKYRLVDFFEEEIENVPSGEYRDDGEYVAPLSREELLAKVISERKLQEADIAIAMDAKDCVIREITVPFTKDEQIRKTVLFEAENYFTGFDLEDSILEYLKIGESDGKSRLIVAALRHDLIEDRLEMCKQASFDPVSIDMDACALFTSFTQTPLFDPARTTLVLDMGTTSTRMLLVENGELRKIRALRLDTIPASARMIPEPATVGADGPEVSVEVVDGEAPAGFGDFSLESRFAEIENALRLLDPGVDTGEPGEEPIAVLSDDEFDRLRGDADQDLDDLGLGEDLDLDLDASAGTATGAGEPSSSDPSAYAGRFPGQISEEKEFDYREYLERVGVELQRSLAGVRLESPIELVCLTGGMSDREEARRFFTDEFDVETVALDFGERIESDVDPLMTGNLGSQGATAVGLGLKLLGIDRAGIDYRKGPFRYEHKFERVKIPLLVASLLLFVFFLQATFWSFRAWKEETARLAGVQRETRDAFEAFFGEAPKGAAFSQARAIEKKWKSGGAGDIPRFVDFNAAMLSLGEVMKDAELGYFILQSLDFKFRIKAGAQSSGSSKSSSNKNRRPDSVPPAKVVLETEDADSFRKLSEGFEKSGKSLFDATPQVKQAREGQYNVTLELNMKQDKLKDF